MGYALEGSVRRAGSQLRVTAQLVDTESDEHLWAEKYDGTLEDVFAIQERLARQIVEALKVQLSPDEERRLAPRPIQDLRAYECYLRARQELWSFSKEGLERALQLLKTGLAIAGDDALLYGTLAAVYGLLLAGVGEVGESREQHLRELEACARKSLELDAESSHGHFAAGMIEYVRGNRQQAARSMKRALQCDPNDVETLVLLGNVYIEVGRPEAAEPLLLRAVDVDPLTAMNHEMLGYLEWVRGRAETGLPHFQRAYELGRDLPLIAWAHAQNLAFLGRRDEACTVVDAISRGALGSPHGRLALMLKHALRGDEAAALAVATSDFEAVVRTQAYLSRDVAGYYAQLGRTEEALAWLERAIESGFVNYPFLAFHHPFYAPIRGEPQFAALMERVRARWEAFEV